MNDVYKYVLLTFTFLPESKSDRKLTHMCNFAVDLLLIFISACNFSSFKITVLIFYLHFCSYLIKPCNLAPSQGEYLWHGSE